MAVKKAAGRPSYREDIKKNRNENTWAGTATSILCREKAQNIAENGAIMRMTQPIHVHRKENVVESTRKNLEWPECRQRTKKIRLHGVYYRGVFCSSEVVDCATPKKTSLTAREMLSHRALCWKLNELGEQRRKDKEELTTTAQRLKDKLKVAKETIVRH